MIRLLLFLAALFVTLTGCSNSGPYRVVPVEGTLTMDGTPVPGVRVTLTPEEGRPSIATTDAEGRFKPWYKDEIYGAQTGVLKVKLEKAESDEMLSAKRTPQSLADKLLALYGHGGTKQATVTLEDATDDLKIELTSD